MNYYKYLKYKEKYLNLKGGFALSQDCIEYGITPELEEDENHPDFLYPKIKSYFKKHEDKFNEYLTLINNFSIDKDANKINETKTDEIIEIFENPEHQTLLEDLLQNYINDDLENYHVQFTSLIFISFILELELFMILYSIIPYNTHTKPDNNNIFIDWINYNNTKTIYDNLLDNNIIKLFNKFTCELELKYKNFVEQFIKGFEISSEFENIKKLFYKDEKNDYRHINKDWISKLDCDQHIIFFLNNVLKKYSANYDPTPMGLFDYIFYKKEYGSCITFSMLEFYLLSRLHIKHDELYLDIESKYNDIHDIHSSTQYHINSVCSHWTCTFLNNKTRSIHKKYRYFSLKNKAEILYSFIFVIYDRYDYYNDNFIKNLKLKYFINLRQDFFKKNLFRTEKIILASIKINPTETWRYIEDKHKNNPKIILEGIRYNILNFYKLYLDKKISIDKPEYFLAALESNQLIYTNIKNKKLLSNKSIIAWGIIQNSNIKDVSVEIKQDREIMIHIINNDGMTLQYADRTLKSDKNIVELAVKNNGLALQFADLTLKSDENIVELAVKNNGLALQYVDQSYKEYEKIIQLSIENNGLALEFAGIFQTDEDIVELVVKNNGLALKFAADQIKTNKDIVVLAVNNNGLALEFCLLSSSSLDEETKKNIVKTAVQNNGLALQFAKQFQTDKDIVKLAVQKDGMALQYAILSEINEEEQIIIVKTAINNNGLALQYVKYYLGNNYYIILIAVRNNGLALQYAILTEINEKEYKKIVETAIANNSLALKYVNDSLKRDYNIIYDAVNNNGLALEYTSLSSSLKFTEEAKKRIIMTAVTNNGLALQFAENFKDNIDIVITAIMNNGLALQFAENFKDNLNIVKLAISNKRDAINYSNLKYIL